jgi:Flp pilus assembly protein TadD
MADCDKALALEPGNIEARSLRGAILAGRGEHQAAIQEYNKALEGNKANAKALYNRGVSWANLQRHDEAISDYLRAIELDPADPSAHNNLGLAYLEKKRLNEAIAEYSLAIALDPKHASAYDNRGYAYMQLGKKEEACRDWYRAAKFGMRQNWDVANTNHDVPGEVLLLPEFTTEEYNLRPPNYPASLQDELIRAVASGDKERVLDLLRKGADPKAPSRGAAPLHVAAERGCLEIAEALLDAGAWVEVQCENTPQLKGRTPLTLAIASRSGDMTLLLLKRGAGINNRDGSGLTALGAALMPMHTVPFDSGPALHWDCNPDFLKVLLEHGADPNQHFDFKLGGSQTTPQLIAVLLSSGEIAIWERNFQGGDAIAPLDAVAMDPIYDTRGKVVEKLLIEHGADKSLAKGR